MSVRGTSSRRGAAVRWGQRREAGARQRRDETRRGSGEASRGCGETRRCKVVARFLKRCISISSPFYLYLEVLHFKYFFKSLYTPRNNIQSFGQIKIASEWVVRIWSIFANSIRNYSVKISLEPSNLSRNGCWVGRVQPHFCWAGILVPS